MAVCLQQFKQHLQYKVYRNIKHTSVQNCVSIFFYNIMWSIYVDVPAVFVSIKPRPLLWVVITGCYHYYPCSADHVRSVRFTLMML